MAVLFYSGVCLSQEQITITTYYPSPNGSFNTLSTAELNTNQINFNPRPDLGSVTHVTEGTMVYVDSNTSDSVPGEFYYYGGGGWLTMPGGTSTYVAWGTSCAYGWTTLYTGRMVLPTLSTTGFSPAQDTAVATSTPVCVAGGSFGGQTHTGGGRLYFRDGGTQNWSRNPISCTVCAK